jgi:cytochrome c5
VKISTLIVVFGLLATSIFLPAQQGVSASPPRPSAQLYQTYCSSCHSGGWQGAPVANDKSEWAPRLEKGFETIFKNAKVGVGAMPPMGTCTDCTDEEFTAVIKEMLEF